MSHPVAPATVVAATSSAEAPSRAPSSESPRSRTAVSAAPMGASSLGSAGEYRTATITPTVVWGTTDRTDEKAEKLGALLTQPGRTYDVSSPDLPTVK